MGFRIIFFFILTILTAKCGSPRISLYEKEIFTYRKNYKKDFLKEERSPLSRSELKYLDFYTPDPVYRVNAAYQLYENPDTLDFKTSSGKIKQFIPFAKLHFTISESACSLIVYRSMQLINDEKYANYLFLPFTDLTCGSETYGGGRYLDLDKSDFKQNSVIIDFNKVYNPYCAFAQGYNCPVPPPENDLNVEIKAGEKKFKKSTKQKL